MSDFHINTTEGDKTPIEFLADLLEQVWPYAAEDVDFSLTDGCNATLSVTYIVQPFGIEKTIDYEISVTPTELRVGCLGSESFDEKVDIEALAGYIDSEVYEDFRSET